MRPVLVLLLLGGTAWADTAATHERTVTKLAEGVYYIRHPDAPDEFPQSNTVVMIGQKDVLVVDSCYLPSDARKDIAQIQKWTKKPVRYLVNTHWHYDHTMGNGAYGEAFPGITVIAHSETAKHMRGYNPAWFERYPRITAERRAELAAGKDADGKELTAERRAELTKQLPARDKVAAEFKLIRDRLPDTTFDNELRLDLGDREVWIRHLGRGNTSGDAILYLPREKILVTGDLLDHPIPYLGGGFPSELVVTLGKMARIDAETVVPGHGEILTRERAKAHIAHVIEFVSLIVDRVSQEIYRIGSGPRNLEKVREAVLKSIDVAAWRQTFGGNDSSENRDYFDDFSLPGVITAAWADMWKR